VNVASRTASTDANRRSTSPEVVAGVVRTSNVAVSSPSETVASASSNVVSPVVNTPRSSSATG